ncbi:MAG TPA: PQQ-binding-like beta-propeller repeat protein [Sphingomonas sp.]
MIGRGSMGTGRNRPALAAALVAAALLSGCGAFKGGGDKPKETVLGERIPVLTIESSSTTDASIAGMKVIVPPADANDSWAQPGGNARKAMGNVALGATPSRAWTVHIAGDRRGARLAATPAVVGDQVFVIDTLAQVRAIDAKTGRVSWTTQLKGQEGVAVRAAGVKGMVGLKARKSYTSSLFGGGVSYDNGKLYATTGLGTVAQLDAATGKVGWRVTPGGPLRGAPTISGGAIYVMTQDNQLFALNEADGATLWTASGPLETAGVFGAAAPAVGHSTVIAGFSSGDLNAYRYENGRVVWQDTLTRTSMSTSVGDVTDIDASPVVDDTRVYAVGAGGRTVALDLLTGQRLWEMNVGGISTPALGGDWLFLISDEAQLFCVQRTTGKIRWTSQLDHWRSPKKKTNAIGWSGPILAGGWLVLTNTRGQLVYVNPDDGKVRLAQRASKKAFSLPPVVAGGALYLLDNEGVLSAWR